MGVQTPHGASSILRTRFPDAPDFRKSMRICRFASHRLTAVDLASKPGRPAAAFGRGSDTATRTAARIAMLVDDRTSLCGSQSPEFKGGANRTAARTSLVVRT